MAALSLNVWRANKTSEIRFAFRLPVFASRSNKNCSNCTQVFPQESSLANINVSMGVGYPRHFIMEVYSTRIVGGPLSVTCIKRKIKKKH